MARPRSLRNARNRHTAQFREAVEVSTYVRHAAAQRRELDDIEFALDTDTSPRLRLSVVVNGIDISKEISYAGPFASAQAVPAGSLADRSGERTVLVGLCSLGIADYGRGEAVMRAWGAFVTLDVVSSEGEPGARFVGASYVFDRGLYREAYERAMLEYEESESPADRARRLILQAPVWDAAQAMGLEPSGVLFERGSEDVEVCCRDDFRGFLVLMRWPWNGDDVAGSVRRVVRDIARWDVDSLDATWLQTRGEPSVPNYPASWKPRPAPGKGTA